jgi:hypothetical protein
LKEGEMTKGGIWKYKNFQVKEGLKPKSKHFQYFFVVSEGNKKKCNYCVWIDDDHLTSLSASKTFDEIVSSGREEWSQWVRKKIDQEDFRNLVWKVEKTGQKEMDLSQLDEKLEAE